MEKLKSTEKWDETFPKGDKVDRNKVIFVNRFGITLAADPYVPKTTVADRLPATVISDLFGAAREQSSGPYTQTLAKQGFLTIASDPSFAGKSSEQPRSVVSPDTNTGDLLATVDYLVVRSDVDTERVDILGICDWGGFTISAAASNTRVKATMASTMYDISRINVNGYFDTADNADARHRMHRELNAQCIKDYRTGTYPCTTVNPEPAGDTPQFVKGYYDYYKTKRGYHSRFISSGLGWSQTSALAFVNAPILAYSDEIRSAASLVHGKKAHPRYLSKDALKKLKDDNRGLMIIPGIVHTDLYDRMGIIPFDEIELLFEECLK